MKELSVVVPIYNEKNSLEELFSLLFSILRENFDRFEVIAVDDGSSDGTFEKLLELKRIYSDMIIIKHRKNFGKTAALLSGLKNTRFSTIATLDADLQDAPDEIPVLYDFLIENNLDLVSGWKYKRHDPLEKVLSSRIFNFILRLLTGLNLHDINCGLKIFRREIVSVIPLYGEMHRFIPFLAYMYGFKVGEKKIRHFPRKYGHSKFNWKRYFSGFFDMLTVFFLSRFRQKPLHFFGTIGLISFFIGFIINLYLTIIWFMGHYIGHRPLLILGVLLIVVGIQFFSIGLVAELFNFEHKKDNEILIERIIK